MGRPKKEEIEVPKCPVCGGKMIEQPIKCNMEALDGRASWHLDFQSKILMCRACSNNMIETLNKWFKNRNKTNIYSKYPMIKEPVSVKEKTENA